MVSFRPMLLTPRSTMRTEASENFPPQRSPSNAPPIITKYWVVYRYPANTCTHSTRYCDQWRNHGRSVILGVRHVSQNKWQSPTGGPTTTQEPIHFKILRTKQCKDSRSSTSKIPNILLLLLHDQELYALILWLLEALSSSTS